MTCFVTNAVVLDGVRVSNLLYPAAQQLADLFGMLLPTPRIADMVHLAASVSWGAEQVYNATYETTTAGCPKGSDGQLHPCRNTLKQSTLKLSSVCDGLAAGREGLADNEGKWFVISGGVFADPSRSGIYGWWRSDGSLVQHNVTAHELQFADYSQVLRYVGPTCVVQPEWQPPFEMATRDIYVSPTWAWLLSAEGPLPGYRHPGVQEAVA